MAADRSGLILFILVIVLQSCSEKGGEFKELSSLTAVWDGNVYYASFWSRDDTVIVSPLFVFKCGGQMRSDDAWHPVKVTGENVFLLGGKVYEPIRNNPLVVLYDQNGILAEFDASENLLLEIHSGSNEKLLELIKSKSDSE